MGDLVAAGRTRRLTTNEYLDVWNSEEIQTRTEKLPKPIPLDSPFYKYNKKSVKHFRDDGHGFKKSQQERHRIYDSVPGTTVTIYECGQSSVIPGLERRVIFVSTNNNIALVHYLQTNQSLEEQVVVETETAPAPNDVSNLSVLDETFDNNLNEETFDIFDAGTLDYNREVEDLIANYIQNEDLVDPMKYVIWKYAPKVVKAGLETEVIICGGFKFEDEDVSGWKCLIGNKTVEIEAGPKICGFCFHTPIGFKAGIVCFWLIDAGGARRSDAQEITFE